MRLQRIEDSKPLVTTIEGDYAVVDSSVPAHGFVPILLKRESGVWRVDLPEIWKNIFYKPSGDHFLKNNNTPYKFGLKRFGKGGYYDIAPVDIGDGNLDEIIAGLEKKNDAFSKYQLAELLFRNAFAAVDAIAQYEEAIRLEPGDPLLLSTLSDRALYLGFPELAQPYLHRLGAEALLRLAQAYGRTKEYDMAEQSARLALDRNSYSWYAMSWLKWALKKQGKTRESNQVGKQIEELMANEEEPWKIVGLRFNPGKPVLYTKQTTMVNGTVVHDHSNFSVTMTNYSNRAVQIDSVELTTAAGKTKGLGDIKSYWRSLPSNYILKPGHRVSFNKTWGFVVDTRHTMLSYIFDVCWHGINDRKQQCEAQRVDLIPENGRFPGKS